jgi:hypothetical protein
LHPLAGDDVRNGPDVVFLFDHDLELGLGLGGAKLARSFISVSSTGDDRSTFCSVKGSEKSNTAGNTNPTTTMRATTVPVP